MIELGPYLQRLEELNVSYPESIIVRRMSSFALYHKLSFIDGLDRFVTEAEMVDAVLRQNHQDIMNSGLGGKVLRIAYERGVGYAFAERHLVIRDGWTRITTEEAKQGVHPEKPLTITNRHVMGEDAKYLAPFTFTVGRPNDKGELWLNEGATVEDYDVVLTGFSRLQQLEQSGSVTWLGSFMDCADIPYNILDDFEPERNREPVEYTSVLG